MAILLQGVIGQVYQLTAEFRLSHRWPPHPEISMATI
jgi:hypothetical protein